MKIFLLTHFFPPGHLGGTEILTLGLARSLQLKGHEVEVICGENWDSAPSYKIEAVKEEFQGIPVHRLHFNWNKAPHVFEYLYNNPEIFIFLSDFIEKNRPDIFHITSCYTLSASVVEAARASNIPVILSATDFWFLCARNTLLHADDSLCPGPENPWECARCMMSGTKFQRWSQKVLPSKIQSRLLKAVSKIPAITNRPGFCGMLGNWEDRFNYLSQSLAQMAHIVTASKFLRDKFIEFGVAPDKISYSSYGLDTAWASGYEIKYPSDSLRLGFIGQIVPFKGPHLLLKAVAALPDIKNLQVKIYGNLAQSPAYGEELRHLAGNDNRVAFLGTFENADMGEVLAEVDVLVVPSTWYDFPLVIPSALATQTPVIATDLPGMNEQIRHEYNGLLFERYDWQGMAVQIRRFVDDAQLLKELRANIQPIKTTDEMAEEYLHLYQQQ